MTFLQWLKQPFLWLVQGFGYVKGTGPKAVAFFERPFVQSLWVAVLAGAVGGFAGRMQLPSLPHFQWPWHWPVIPNPGPGPAPKPTPAPIPVSGLHVLVVTDRTTALTPAQQLALSSGDVRSYLNQTCPAGPSGQKEWRFLDKSADLTNESPLWQEAFKRTSGKPVPYIIVSNPDKGGGFEGALPTDAASLLALLKKYGG